MQSNGKQSIPPLFKEIMRNDNQRSLLKSLTVIPFEKMSDLIREKRMYRRAAEKALSWNVDKGATA